MDKWERGVVDEKIKPYKVIAPDGRVSYVTHKEVMPPTGIASWSVSDDDEVTVVND